MEKEEQLEPKLKPFPHDASYKKLVSHKEVMTHLVQGYFHDDFSGEIDWDSLELVPSEYSTGDLRRRANDLAWRLRRRGSGEEEWTFVYGMLEFQSSPDAYTAVRMLTYLGAFYESVIDYQHLPKGEELPEVLLVVIYNGEGRWNGACELDGLIKKSTPGLKAYRPSVSFKLLEAFQCGKARTERNFAEAIFRIERAPALEDMVQVMDDLITWFEGGQFEEVDRSFAIWLTRLIRHRYEGTEIPDMHTVKDVRKYVNDELIPWGSRQFAKHAEEAAQSARTKALAEGFTQGRAAGLTQGRAEGRAEGLTQGRAEGRAEGLREALSAFRGSLAKRTRDRFGVPTAGVFSAEIESVDNPGDLIRIADWIDSSDTAEALLDLIRTR